MKAKVIAFLMVLLFTGIRAENRMTDFKNGSITPKSDWWEPDTVTLSSIAGNRSREILKYSEQGKTVLRMMENLDGETWVSSTRNTFTFNDDGNPLTEMKETFTDGVWTISEKRTFVYDDDGNRLSNTFESLVNNVLTNKDRNICEYDANSNMLSETYQQWKQEAWSNNWKQIYEYDSRNNVTLNLYESYWEGELNASWRTWFTYDERNNVLTNVHENMTEGEWIETSSNIFTYDDRNNILTNRFANQWETTLLTYTYNEWNSVLTELKQSLTNDEWLNIYRDTHTYGTPDHKPTLLLREEYMNDSWVETAQQIYEYDSNGYQTSRTNQTKNEGEWQDSWGNTYAHDANGNLTEDISWTWSNGARLNGERMLYEYTAQNKQTLNMKQTWDVAGEQWIDVQANKYTYDDQSNMLTSSYEYWQNGVVSFGNRALFSYDENSNGIAGEYFDWKEDEWVAADGWGRQILYNGGQSTYTTPSEGWQKIELSYKKQGSSGIQHTTVATTRITAYPNPTSGSVTVKATSPLGSIQIIDTWGRVLSITNHTGDYETTIDLSGYASGVYFLKTDSATLRIMKK